MTTPDFELSARIRAKRLGAHVPPDAQTPTEGGDVTLVRDEQRRGVPPKMESGECYSDIAIDKRLVGARRDGGETDGASLASAGGELSFTARVKEWRGSLRRIR